MRLKLNSKKLYTIQNIKNRSTPSSVIVQISFRKEIGLKKYMYNVTNYSK